MYANCGHQLSSETGNFVETILFYKGTKCLTLFSSYQILGLTKITWATHYALEKYCWSVKATIQVPNQIAGLFDKKLQMSSQLLVSLAVGTLVGDSLIHLIPHAFGAE